MTVASADYPVLITSLDQESFPAERVLALYRLRWQVELAFRRLKSLLRINWLPAKDPGRARAWLTTHLIVALLIDAKTRKVLDSFPSATRQARPNSLAHP
jgi:IS4 transposase